MNENTLQANTPDVNLIDALLYTSYEANRGYGITHEELEKVFRRDLTAYADHYIVEGSPKYCKEHREKFQYLWDVPMCEICFFQSVKQPCSICSIIGELDERSHCIACANAQRDEFSGVAAEDRDEL